MIGLTTFLYVFTHHEMSVVKNLIHTCTAFQEGFENCCTVHLHAYRPRDVYIRAPVVYT